MTEQGDSYRDTHKPREKAHPRPRGWKGKGQSEIEKEKSKENGRSTSHTIPWGKLEEHEQI